MDMGQSRAQLPGFESDRNRRQDAGPAKGKNPAGWKACPTLEICILELRALYIHVKAAGKNSVINYQPL